MKVMLILKFYLAFYQQQQYKCCYYYITIPAGAEIRTHNLRLLYPLGHDCP